MLARLSTKCSNVRYCFQSLLENINTNKSKADASKFKMAAKSKYGKLLQNKWTDLTDKCGRYIKHLAKIVLIRLQMLFV